MRRGTASRQPQSRLERVVQLEYSLLRKAIISGYEVREDGGASCVHGILKLLKEGTIFIAVMHTIFQRAYTDIPELMEPCRVRSISLLSVKREFDRFILITLRPGNGDPATTSGGLAKRNVTYAVV
jgi:hypothetical protein